MTTSSFCFPCSPSSAAKNVVDDPLRYVPSSIKASDANITNFTPPTGQEYASQAAREFTYVLDAVAQAVPVPVFGAAVKVAVNIIRACDESQATLEHAEELKVRIKTLVAVFVNELKGKKKEEISAKLIQDISTLNKDMEYIKKTLDKIASQHCLLLIFFRSLNDSRVSECVTKVNNSLESFNLSCTINHTTILTQLKQQIMMFYTEHQESLKIIQVTMNDVKAMLDERLPVNTMLGSLSRAPIPTNSAISHGRDSLITELVGVITGLSQKHICLFGPGGMGKTSPPWL
ncbi:hypothetical protein E4T56_gene11116 [Termitomyces sp. T112]|nr:hypothetical protein E4T56_gene11116 [Termitomyces sp. T112]